jgi:iron complex outermembrane receptor protein
VDVLNGPQGTLFGRNATGGVIQIQTQDPSQQPKLDLSGTYGRYDYTSASAYLSGGLSEAVATSLSVLYENQAKGFGRNLLNNREVNELARHNISLRNTWLLRPMAGTTIHLSADYADLGNTNAYQRPPGSITTLPAAIPPLSYPGRYNTNIGQPDFARLKTGGASVKVEQDVGSLVLTSITAYRRLNNRASLDQDQSSVAALDLTWRTRFKNFSQEVRLQNQANTGFKWIVGAFYYNATGAYVDLKADGFTFIDYDRQKTESLAGFAQATVEVVPRLNLTGGVRYTWEKASFRFPTYGLAPPAQSVRKFTYRAALDYRFAPDVMGYVSYNTGFKSGGFNLLAPGASFAPEELDALETGLKSELFDRTLRLNVGAFYYWYKNQQVSIPSVGGDIIANAAGSHIKGLEASFELRATSRLRLDGGLTLMRGRYTKYPAFQSYDPNGNPLGAPRDLSGFRTVQTPNFVGTLSGTYTQPTEVGLFDATVGVQHNSGYYAAPDNRLAQPSYTLVNASIGWRSQDGHVEFRVWGKNLADETYYIIQSPNRAPVGDTQIEAPPRTFGATVTWHY